MENSLGKIDKGFQAKMVVMNKKLEAVKLIP
jgi:N-acetylglucosamine-6-phosphate deacetylase